jgi:predicted transcriptional regulator
MSKHPFLSLSRRERQIMDVLYRLGRATATEVIEALPDERHSSTVRTQLRLLEQKGHLLRENDGQRFVYRPAVSRNAARKSALKHLVETFFDGSVEQTVSTLLLARERDLSPEELERLVALIEKTARDGRL